MSSDIEQIEAFVERIRNFPCLYKTRDLSYRDSIAKQNAWKQVAKEFNITGKYCIDQSNFICMFVGTLLGLQCFNTYV